MRSTPFFGKCPLVAWYDLSIGAPHLLMWKIVHVRVIDAYHLGAAHHSRPSSGIRILATEPSFDPAPPNAMRPVRNSV